LNKDKHQMRFLSKVTPQFIKKYIPEIFSEIFDKNIYKKDTQQHLIQNYIDAWNPENNKSPSPMKLSLINEYLHTLEEIRYDFTGINKLQSGGTLIKNNTWELNDYS